MENPSTPNLVTLRTAWLHALGKQSERALELRRRIHSAPEISGDEVQTAELITAELAGIVDLETIAQTGRIGRLGPKTGPAVGIRAELDALPVLERTGAPFAANNGAMHACGHDVHMSALVLALLALDEVRRVTGADLPVALAPVFQPREETYPSGALDIVSEQGLSRVSIAHMIGVHVHPEIPVGHLAIGAGYINAAADEVEIVVHGRGGHGAYPHNAADPVAAVSTIALSLPEIVRRTVGPMSPAVVSIGTMQVGEGAANVLPREGRIRATVRTTSTPERRSLHAAIRQLAEGVSSGYGLEGSVRVVDGEPVLLNDASLAARFGEHAMDSGLQIAQPMRSLGADDFSYFSEAVPSVMSFIGTRLEDEPSPPLHDASFLPADRIVLDTAHAMIAGYCAAADSILEAGRS